MRLTSQAASLQLGAFLLAVQISNLCIRIFVAQAFVDHKPLLQMHGFDKGAIHESLCINKNIDL